MRLHFPHRALLALAASLASLACSPAARERLREHTYPPSFNYITQEQLHAAMWQLADHSAQLDRLMREPGAGDEPLQARVILELGEMERAAAELGPGGWPSNHPLVSRNIDRFRQDLADARHAAALEPPSFFLAGSVSGACMHCHGGE
jgi:hypothetical protein